MHRGSWARGLSGSITAALEGDADTAAKLGCFCTFTGDSKYSYKFTERNIATFALVFVVGAIFFPRSFQRADPDGTRPVSHSSWSGVSAFPWGAKPDTPSIRKRSWPRIAHAILSECRKGGSDGAFPDSCDWSAHRRRACRVLLRVLAVFSDLLKEIGSRRSFEFQSKEATYP